MSSLELKNLIIDTKDGKRVLDGVSLSVAPGKLHLLMGSNGSGKSSLLNALMGHPKYALISGSVVLDDVDITALPTEEKAKKGLFLSLQHVPEIPGVTMVNFLHRAYQALSGKQLPIPEFYAKLKSLAESIDIDPQFVRRELNAGFSGGEKKMSEMLQMTLLEPKYAFLDEIDSGVDVDALKKILAGVTRAQKAGTGILLVTHNTSILEHLTPNTVTVMANGKIVREGGNELVSEIKAKGFTQYLS